MQKERKPKKDLLSTRFNNKCNLLRRNEDNKVNQQYRYTGDGFPEGIKTLCRLLALEKQKQLFHRPVFTPLTARVTYNHQLKPSHQTTNQLYIDELEITQKAVLAFHKYVTIYSVVRIKKGQNNFFCFYSWCLHLKYKWWQFFLYCLCLCHLEDNIEVSIKTGIPGEQRAIIMKNDPINPENKPLGEQTTGA